MLGLGVFEGEFAELVVLLEQAFDLRRDGLEGLEDFQGAPGGEHADAAEVNGEQQENGEGGNKGFGGGDADLGPGMHVNAAVGLAGDGAADDVDNRQDPVTAAFGFAQRGQGVGGLTGLGNDEEDGALLERGVAVAEFVRELDLDGDMGEFLDEIFADERGMPTGAAGGNDDAVDGAQGFGGEVESAEA